MSIELSKLPYQELGSQETQLFIGISLDLKKNETLGETLEIEMYRNCRAGSANGLYAMEPEALTFRFHNRVLLICIPEAQREEVYKEVVDKLYMSDVRDVVFVLHTRYTNAYSGEIISTVSERFTIERELINVTANDISESRHYLPIDKDSAPHDIITVHDCVTNPKEPHVDRSKNLAADILEYFADVPVAFYNPPEGKRDYHWFIYSKLYVDPSIGHVVYGGHMGYNDDLHAGVPIVNVTITTKDKLKSVNLTFLDPQGTVETFLKAPAITIRFRDYALHGVDLCPSDYDIEIYQA